MSYKAQIIFIVAILLLLSLCSPVQAEIWLDVPLKSHHSDAGYYKGGELKEFNENNIGLGVAYGLNNNVELIAGGYRNSYYKSSFYAGSDFHTSSKRTVRVGISAGVISGYPEGCLALLPNVVFSTKPVRVKIGWYPKYKNSTSAVSISIGVLL